MTTEPLSTTILRERGPMTLRDLTSATALRMGTPPSYNDVATVLEHERQEGRVRRNSGSADYREWVWEVSSAPTTPPARPQTLDYIPEGGMAPPSSYRRPNLNEDSTPPKVDK